MEVLSPAKVNLFLHVTGKRDDGYHTLYSLMCAVGIYDKIELQFSEADGIFVTCDHPLVPDGEKNIVYKAAADFYLQSEILPGVRIKINKEIPVGAGLGGGSTNAANVLVALNTHYGNPIDKSTLSEIALKAGADVPFFLEGKPSIATGVGEELEKSPELLKYKVLLVYPGIAVSTPEVYKKLNLALTKPEKETKNLLLNEGKVDACRYLWNDLENVAFSMHQEISALKSEMLDNGADGALMSGSGSTVFGLFSDEDKAEQAYKYFLQYQHEKKVKGISWKVFLADMLV